MINHNGTPMALHDVHAESLIIYNSWCDSPSMSQGVRSFVAQLDVRIRFISEVPGTVDNVHSLWR